MSDIQYISGIIISAEALTGITGAQTFGGEDIQGYYSYNIKLNPLAGERRKLIDSDQPEYDYIVDQSGGLKVRDDWVSDIQDEVYWNLVEINTEIEVSTNNVNWTKMNFESYDPSSPDGKPYYVWVDGRTDWTSIDGAEVFEITMAAASTLNSKYFIMYSVTDTTYYVWFNNDSTGNDPAGPGGDLAGLGYVGVEVALLNADSAESVAIKSKVVIHGLTEFISMISPNDSKIIAVATSSAGSVYDAQPGNSGLAIEVKIQGGDTENYQYARIPRVI